LGRIRSARQTALRNIQQAQTDLKNLAVSNPSRSRLEALLEQSQIEYKNGQVFEDALAESSGRDVVYTLAKAVRAHTRAQVRVAQVSETLNPPPSKSEDFGG
jgi:hypothetical protein